MDLLAPELHFRLGGTLAMTGWAALALSPASRRWAPAARVYAGFIVPLLLGLAYAALFIAHRGPGGYGSLAEVTQLFQRPGLLAAGWLHFLAFDLFVGSWIAGRAAALGLHHAALLPCLLLCFLFGPVGLLAFAALCALRRKALYKA